MCTRISDSHDMYVRLCVPCLLNDLVSHFYDKLHHKDHQVTERAKYK